MGCTNSGMVHENASKLVQNVKDLNEKGEHIISGVETTVMKGFDDIKETISDMEKDAKQLMGTLTGDRNETANAEETSMSAAMVKDDDVTLVDEMKVIEIAGPEDGDDDAEDGDNEQPISTSHETPHDDIEPRPDLESHRSVDDSLGEMQKPHEMTESAVSGEVLDTENTNM